ncbi:MAG: T9SS type A sorting domain-containing protein [Bacteroidota bacterium]
MKIQVSQQNAPTLKQKQTEVFKPALILLAGIVALVNTQTQHISGIVNAYAQVTEIQANVITVDDAVAFSPGDKLLVIQMKGASIVTSDDSTYGDVSSWGYSGNYEFGEVVSVSGNQIILAYDLCKTYDPSHIVQAVRVPVYEDVRVTGKLTAQSWDGTKGGIVAIWANNKVILEDDIDVKGLGFKGGIFNGSSTPGGDTYICSVQSGEGGRKGEGIVEVPYAGCRGKQATGGGGGNDHNGGGGGGGNYGQGGLGGHGWKARESDLDKGGRGGLSLASMYQDGFTRLFLGGGGGGHQNNGAAYRGGNGGGIVVVVAKELEVSSSARIDASGEDAMDVYVNDGASGGGAGGSIMMDIQHYLSGQDSLNLNVSGGDGADIHTAAHHGTGGGGGGGLINAPRPIDTTIQVILDGGKAGIFYSTKPSGHMHTGTTHGATAGADGGILDNLILQKCSAAPILYTDHDKRAQNRTQAYSMHGSPQYIGYRSTLGIEDVDDANLAEALVEIINPADMDAEYLTTDLSAAAQDSLNISIEIDSGGHKMVLSGTASLENYREALIHVQYANEALSTTMDDRIISFVVNDGGVESDPAYMTLTMPTTKLPVEWLYFQANIEGGQSLLSWATSSEQNADYFEVERSSDAVYFETIGKVRATGTTQETQTYGFSDGQLIEMGQSYVYYRLKQVDFNGQFEYSKMVELTIDQTATVQGLKLAPNPAKDFVQVSLAKTLTQGGTLTIVSMNGQVVYQEALSDQQRTLQVNLSQWASGSYVVNVRSGRQQYAKKLIVK